MKQFFNCYVKGKSGLVLFAICTLLYKLFQGVRMKYFYVYYQNGYVGRYMETSKEEVIKHLGNLGILDFISSIKEIA